MKTLYKLINNSFIPVREIRDEHIDEVQDKLIQLSFIALSNGVIKEAPTFSWDSKGATQFCATKFKSI